MNGTAVELETHTIRDVFSAPDTVITTTRGNTYTVKESVDEVVALFESCHSPGETLRYYSPALKIMESRARFRHEICELNEAGLLHARQRVSPIERLLLATGRLCARLARLTRTRNRHNE